jgi:hypothetical protein
MVRDSEQKLLLKASGHRPAHGRVRLDKLLDKKLGTRDGGVQSTCLGRQELARVI